MCFCTAENEKEIYCGNGDCTPPSVIDHPAHYGGKDNVYEAIKVIEAWDCNFHIGNALKYLCRAGKKDFSDHLGDLEKARWYIDREIENRGKQVNLYARKTK